MPNISLCVLLSLSIAGVFPFDKNATFKNYYPEETVDRRVRTAMVEIVSTCRPSAVTQEIYILGGDYNEFLKARYFANVSVGLVDETSYRYDALRSFALTKYFFTAYQSYFMNLLQKAHRFLFVASSQPILRAIFQRTKDSPWANPEGLYILVDSKFRGCVNARSYLWTAWEYDLLSVIFICTEPPDGIVLYTYNPYTNYTPSGWKEVARAKGRKGHPFIIMRKPYDGVENISCENLDFDKTRNLDGYVIRLNAVEMEPFIKMNLSAPFLEKFRGDNSEIIKILLQRLNAHLAIYVSDSNVYALGDVSPNGTLTGLLAPLSAGTIDIGMNVRSLISLWKVRYTYPHTRSGLCVFTKPRPALSSFVKLIAFVSPGALAGILLTCLLTCVVFARTEGHVGSALQILRLVVCVAVLRPPRTNSSRIFLCMALILFLNVNALFQSHLSSLLTVPVYYHNIDTVEDLKRSGYTIYGPSIFKTILGDPELEPRYVPVTYDECKEFVENSTAAACLGDCYHIYYRIKGQNFVKSKMLREMVQSYVTREDWPLFDRVNRIIQRMTEAGLILKSREDTLFEIRRERKIRKQQKKTGFSVMLLSQLTFSFQFLGVGYACATVVFVVELIVGAYSSRELNGKRKGGRAKIAARGTGPTMFARH